MFEFLGDYSLAYYAAEALKWVGVASLAATITPTKKDDTIVGYAKGFIHFLAFNFGAAKNEK